MLPSPPDFGQKFLAILLQLPDDSGGRSRLFMPRSPNQQLQKHRRQINPFLSEPVVYSASIRFFHLRGNDPGLLEPPQTLRQDVGGDFLAAFPEFLECLASAHHQIADDQQRPAVSQHFE